LNVHFVSSFVVTKTKNPVTTILKLWGTTYNQSVAQMFVRNCKQLNSFDNIFFTSGFVKLSSALGNQGLVFIKRTKWLRSYK